MGILLKGLWTEVITGGGGRGRQSHFSSRSTSSSHLPLLSSVFVFKVLAVQFLVILSCGPLSVMGTECLTRRYYEVTVTMGYFGSIRANNRTLTCDMSFQWTVADYCCYNSHDRNGENPFCCYSETYKLVLAVGFICLVLLSSSLAIFFCWVYNLPHHILCLLTCGKFNLNNWMTRNKNGPYVDPSFYAGEPFWARGAEMQPYPLRPLRPMPPKIFYPAPPTKMKRWDMASGEIPLFIIASRQFTRNPYSARPQDRSITSSQHHLSQSQTSLGGGGGLSTVSESRRSSLGGCGGPVQPPAQDSRSNTPYPTRREASSAPNGVPRRGSSALMPYRGGGGGGGGGGGNSSMPPPAPFRVNIDETEAAMELIEALKLLDERGDKTVAEWNAMSPPPDLVDNNHRGPGDHGIFMISEGSSSSSRRLGDSTDEDDLNSVRPNTTGGGGVLDQYGNYVSLTNHHHGSSLYSASGGSRAHVKPNTEALNQQFGTLGMPVYSMPGVNTAGVVSTIQNYHVVSTNLGNPMETILEDDSIDEDLAMMERGGDFRKSSIPKQSSSSTPSSKNGPAAATKQNKNQSKKSTPTTRQPHQGQLRRRDTIAVPQPAPKSKKTVPAAAPPPRRVSSGMDHVLMQEPTTRALVPFSPTLPGSLPGGGGSSMDAAYIESVIVQQSEPSGGRRNSIV